VITRRRGHRRYLVGQRTAVIAARRRRHRSPQHPCAANTACVAHSANPTTPAAVGRTWKSRSPVFVSDLVKMTDCVRVR